MWNVNSGGILVVKFMIYCVEFYIRLYEIYEKMLDRCDMIDMCIFVCVDNF